MSKKRSLKEQKEYFTQPADGVRFVEESPAPEPEVSTEINYSDLFVKAFDDFEEKLKKEREEKVRESVKEGGLTTDEISTIMNRQVSTEDLKEDRQVSTEELIRMSIDITNGAVKPPSSFDAAHRRAWAILLREISAISARGGVVDIPSEIP